MFVPLRWISINSSHFPSEKKKAENQQGKNTENKVQSRHSSTQTQTYRKNEKEKKIPLSLYQMQKCLEGKQVKSSFSHWHAFRHSKA